MRRTSVYQILTGPENVIWRGGVFEKVLAPISIKSTPLHFERGIDRKVRISLRVAGPREEVCLEPVGTK